MTEQRGLAILAAYGADPARWPADEREGLRVMLGAPALQAALHEAKVLDASLSRARAADHALASDRLLAQVLASAPLRADPAPAPRPSRSLAALAACAVLGLAAGFGAGQFAPNSIEDSELEALVAEALAPSGAQWLSEGGDG